MVRPCISPLSIFNALEERRSGRGGRKRKKKKRNEEKKLAWYARSIESLQSHSDAASGKREKFPNSKVHYRICTTSVVDDWKKSCRRFFLVYLLGVFFPLLHEHEGFLFAFLQKAHFIVSSTLMPIYSFQFRYFLPI